MSAEQSDNELVRELREKVQRLEERLADHESRLKSLEPSKLIPTAPLPPIPAPPPVQPVSMLETLARLSAEKEAKKEPPPSGPPTDEIRAAFAKNLAAIAKPPVVPPTKPAAPPTKPVAPPAKPVAQPAKPPSPPPLPRQHPGYPPPPRPGKSLESWIGKSWASWLGGILVLGAVLFFLKYAWDQGWINPTPLGRILLASAVGAAMVGLGQWLHFKHMRALAASLVGCGLAVLMGTMFAANIAFEQPVLSSGTTFTLVAIIGGAGIAFALQMRTMSLAILALLGMYLSPAILSTGSDQSPQFLAYLAVVTATGLGVSFFKRNWWAVRILTFVCGWFWLIVWTIQLGGSHSYLGTAACAGFFVLFLGELALSLHRVMTPPVDEMAPDRPPSPNTLRLESGAAVMAFINTTLAMTMFAILEATGAGLAPLWTLAMGLAGVMGILTFATPSRLFSLSAGIQAMALVIVAVPLYFTHSAITYAWATLGLALGIYARITNSRFARVWMFIMLLLVIARLWTFDAVNPGLNATLFSIGGESFTAWMLMSWGAALYALGLGWLSIREPVESQKTGNVLPMLLITFCALAGTLLSAAAAARGLLESVPSHAFTFTAAIWILVLIAWSNLALPKRYRLPGEIVALILLALTTIKWLLDGQTHDLKDRWVEGYGPPWSVFSMFTLNAGVLAAGVCLSQILRKTNLAVQVVWVTILALGVAARVLPLEDAFTLAAILWTLLLIGWSYLLRSPERRTTVSIVALVLLALISAKWLLIDGIVNTPSPFSFLSLFTLNAVLLAAGVCLSQVLRKLNLAVQVVWVTILAFVVAAKGLPLEDPFTLAVILWTLLLIGWSY
ncbi:MAG: DUF2339 domain-containing protein, partial [Phycisphaerales bacterium]|nr:DUF2339 domain-containing protein [Phycisphaerales bacterium]